MDDRAADHRSRDAAESVERPDRETLQKVRDILNLFSNAVGAMKIFPSYHENVLKVLDELHAHLTAYLDDHMELEIGIGENYFTFRDEEVFKDPNAVKSLPYLFFKDGMGSFTLGRGLAREEVAEFLEIVKTNILLPPDKGDIVDALWEREFFHIRYYAPDEFLETKIAQGKVQPYDYHVERADLYKGKIELAEEDMKDVYAASFELGLQKEQPGAPTAEELAASLDKSETLLLDSMLSTERRYSSEKEFLELLFEVLYLEQRPAQFLDLLGHLDSHHHRLLQANDLLHVSLLIDMIASLRSTLHAVDPGREALVEEILKKTLNGITLEELETAIRPESTDPRLFYEYMKRLGPRLLPYALETFETNAAPEWRAAGFDFLRDMSLTEMLTLANMAQDRKPELTKALIRLISARPDRKSILQLAAFVNYTNPEIKREAIEALGAIADDLANKVLIEFLHDPSERVRIEAARVARLDRDRRALEKIVDLTGEKEFQERSVGEKEAILGLLARTGDKQAVAALRALVEKSALFGRAKQDETRLYAAEALATMKSPEAVEALKAQTRHSNKKIADICQKALDRLAAAEAPMPSE
jgi:HEAT repeat protein